MPYRYLPECLILSVSIHALAAYALHTPPAAEEKTVFVSTVEYLPASHEPAKKTAPKAKPLVYPPVKKKASQGLPAAVSPKKAAAQTKNAPVLRREAPRIRQEVIPVDEKALSRDPEKGKFFTDYFSRVKERIRQTLEAKSKAKVGRGKVTILFVLDSDGHLERASVLDRQSDGGDGAKRLAEAALAASAPFPHFPKELAMNRLSFHVTVYFEER
ncbi:MAG: TonB family protein [Candidatus Omnitrophica bacterium]|nr:TonB family protein [Candidatus Omnitrophota bacterium]